MARIVGGSPMGELRGKLGSSVFSRNASGSYVRSYVVPVNTNTISQQSARSSFAQVVGAYHSLSSQAKELWDEWALTSEEFSSGFNAFVSSNNIIRGNQNVLNVEFMADGDGTITYEDWVSSPGAPRNDMVVPYSLSLTDANLTYSTSSGEYEFDVQLTIVGSDNVTGPGPNTDFTPSGVAFYVSRGNSQPGMFTKNRNIKIAASKIIASITEGTSFNSTLQFNDFVNLTGNKSAPNIFDYVRISAYWNDKYGREVFIGSYESRVLQSS